MRTGNVVMGLGSLASAAGCCGMAWVHADYAPLWAFFTALTFVNSLLAGSLLARGLFGRRKDQ